MMDQEAVSHSLIGAVLRDARESQKLSVEEVCSRLRLSDKQINALESDDFSIFGSAIFARGFIKGYAKILNLDSQPLLDAHLRMFPQDQSQSITYKADDVVKSGGGSFIKFVALILGVLLIVAVVVWVAYKVWAYQSNTNVADNSTPAVSVEQNVTSEPLPEAALPAAERETPANNESTVTEIALPKAKETVDVTPKPEVKSPTEKPKEPAQLVDSVKSDSAKSEFVKTQTVAVGSVKVKLVLTGSSWIGVQDKNGKTVFSKLAKAGTEEYVEGVPPLKFHIGNASATQVIFNGEAIDLAPSTYNNMARITVGEH
jgi:cytoskeleton protein RodZ